MTVWCPKFLAPFKIVEDVNDDIRVADDYASPTWYTATLAAGTYYMASTNNGTGACFFDALVTALDAAAPISFISAPYERGDNMGHFYLKTTDANGFRINCDYTAGGFNGFDWTWLGLSAATIAADFGSSDTTSVVSDYQVKYGWWGERPAEWDTENGTEAEIVDNRAKSKQRYQHQIGDDCDIRSVRLGFEPRYRAYPGLDSDDNERHNEDWLSFWRLAKGGHVLYFPHNETYGGGNANGTSTERSDYDNSWGWWKCRFTGDSLVRAMPRRQSHATALYSWEVDLAEEP